MKKLLLLTAFVAASASASQPESFKVNFELTDTRIVFPKTENPHRNIDLKKAVSHANSTKFVVGDLNVTCALQSCTPDDVTMGVTMSYKEPAENKCPRIFERLNQTCRVKLEILSEEYSKLKSLNANLETSAESIDLCEARIAILTKELIPFFTTPLHYTVTMPWNKPSVIHTSTIITPDNLNADETVVTITPLRPE